jgi:hypothetical protein
MTRSVDLLDFAAVADVGDVHFALIVPAPRAPACGANTTRRYWWLV